LKRDVSTSCARIAVAWIDAIKTGNTKRVRILLYVMVVLLLFNCTDY
jgi:hypothetical protein